VSALGPLLLLAGIALVVAGAEAFFQGLLATAARLRVPPFVLTVLVSGFELENLAAGIALDLRHLPDSAAGTFLGGTTFLALGVAGLSATAAPLRAPLPRPVLAWSVAGPLPLLALGVDGDLTRAEGAVLLAWSVLCLAGLAHAGRGLAGSQPLRSRRFAAVRMLAGLGVLSGGGELLSEGLHRTVTGLGVSGALLGNTAVAAAVEAEEVARVAVPARRGRSDVAAANLLGTVVHFAALNAGVIALVRPLQLGSVSRHLHLPVAVASVAVLVTALASRGGLSRRDGALLLTAYAAYVAAAIAVSV
jgi:cation:H+ antiporter